MMPITAAELLSEPVEVASRRETRAFGALLAQSNLKVVLYGAGRLGRKTLAAFRQNGIHPLAFADNDPNIDGTEVEGVRVLSPSAAAERWRDDAVFVVTTFLPSSGGVQGRENELAALGCRRISNFLLPGWAYGGILPHFGADMPSHLLKHARELAAVDALWSDSLSRDVFAQQLEWRLLGDFSHASEPAPNQYFPRDILRPNPDEMFVDGGAFDGDTMRSAPWQLARVIAIEPDPANAAKLRALSETRVQMHEVLLGRAAGASRFDGNGTMASSRSDVGAMEVSVATLDDLAAGENPTFIKLDVEGDELAALQGGRQTMKRCNPVVAACVYHRPEDLWTIPLFLHDVLPGHRMYLRAHAWDGFELVAYAVPPKRCVQPQ